MVSELSLADKGTLCRFQRRIRMTVMKGTPVHLHWVWKQPYFYFSGFIISGIYSLYSLVTPTVIWKKFPPPSLRIPSIIPREGGGNFFPITVVV